jgi:hypothetical protein
VTFINWGNPKKITWVSLQGIAGKHFVLSIRKSHEGRQRILQAMRRRSFFAQGKALAVTLYAFSGQYNGRWTVRGWVGPVFFHG